MKRCYALTTGNTFGCHMDLMQQLTEEGLTEVKSQEECDVIIAFCPIISRVGADIQDALSIIPKGNSLYHSKHYQYCPFTSIGSPDLDN